MKAKVLLRNIGIVMLMLAVGLTAYGFISDSNNDKDKVVLNATDAPEDESTVATSTEATETVSEETEAPEATEITTENTETPASAQPDAATGTEGSASGETSEVNTADTPATSAPTELPSDESGAEQTKTYTLVVSKGMSAMQIANRLEENGIIKDAAEFTQVMVSKGVTNDINVGNYEFTSNNTYDQIISALTGSQK